MKQLATTAIIAVVALGLLAWMGGEMHYRNCLQAVEVRHGPAIADKPVTPTEGVSVDEAAAIEDALDKLDDPARAQALDACSRLPF